jgi:hypothetical protein
LGLTRETVESWLYSAIGTWLASLTMHGHRRTGTERSTHTPNEVREMGSIRGARVCKEGGEESEMGWV